MSIPVSEYHSILESPSRREHVSIEELGDEGFDISGEDEKILAGITETKTKALMSIEEIEQYYEALT